MGRDRGRDREEEKEKEMKNEGGEMGSLMRLIRKRLGRRWRTIPKEAMPKHARQSGCERKGKQADWYVRRRDDGYVSEEEREGRK